jgi:hydroxymethylbilane synthase
MNLSVFISRSEEDSSVLLKFLREKNISFSARSLIRTEAVAFDPEIPACDWIFFSSANAVKFFFESNPHIGSIKTGAVGDSTARVLAKFTTPNFIGDSSDIDGTARKFQELAKNQIVLFPGSEQSLRHIQSVFDPSKIIDLVCYRTVLSPLVLDRFETLVFSSPSNVQSFFLQNKIDATQKTIAFGKSTEKALRQFGAQNIIIPKSLSDIDLFEAIKSTLHS